MQELTISEHTVQEAKWRLVECLGAYADKILTSMADPKELLTYDLARIAVVWSQGGTYEVFLDMLHEELDEKYYGVREVLGDRFIAPREVDVVSGRSTFYEPYQLRMLADSVPSVMAGEFLVPKMPNAVGHDGTNDGWFIARLLEESRVSLNGGGRIATAWEARWILETYHRVRGEWPFTNNARLRTGSVVNEVSIELIVSHSSERLIEIKQPGLPSKGNFYQTLIIIN